MQRAGPTGGSRLTTSRFQLGYMDGVVLQETESRREGVWPYEVRRAQQGAGCVAPRSGDSQFCPEPEHQERFTIGSVSPYDGSGLTKLLGNRQSGRETQARTK